MKGTLVKIWINTLHKTYNKEEINRLLHGISFDTERVISPFEDISDAVVDTMMTEIAGHYHISKSELWKVLGKDNIKTFHEMYPIFFKKENMFSFLCSLNDIHQVVKKRIPGSKPAILNMEVVGNQEAILTYMSNRNLFDYLLGLLDGTMEFFKEKVEVEVLEKKDGKMKVSLKFGYRLIERKSYLFSKWLSFGFLKSQAAKIGAFALLLGVPTAYFINQPLLSSLLTAFYGVLGAYLLQRPKEMVEAEIDGLIQKNYLPSKRIETMDEYEEIFEKIVDYKSSFAEGFVHLSSMTGEMANFSRDLIGIAREMELTSSDINDFISKLYEKALMQWETTEGNVATLSDNSRQIVELAKKEMQNKLEVEKAVQMTSDSFAKLNKTTNNLAAMKAKFEVLNKNSEKLRKKGTETEEIASFVSDIAFQTNLLALNASIEAARAGEMGKGFAVVAEEVRKLAQNSEQAASRIKENINSFLSDIETMVADIHEQNEILEVGVETIHEAIGQTEISKTEMDQVAGKMSESAEKLELQATNLKGIVKNMQVLKHTSNENAELAKSASQRVNSYSEELEKLTTDIESFEAMTKEFDNLLVTYRF